MVKHHTHGKTGRRRSHMALTATDLYACASCKAPVRPHRICAHCGARPVRRTRTTAS